MDESKTKEQLKMSEHKLFNLNNPYKCWHFQKHVAIKIGLLRLKNVYLQNLEFYFIYIKKFKGTLSTPTFFCFSVIYIYIYP